VIVQCHLGDGPGAALEYPDHGGVTPGMGGGEPPQPKALEQFSLDRQGRPGRNPT